MKPSSFCFTSAPDHPTSNGELRHCRRLSRRTSLAAKTTIATKNLHLTDSMAPPGRLSLQSHTAAAFSPSKKKIIKKEKKKTLRERANASASAAEHLACAASAARARRKWALAPGRARREQRARGQARG